MNYARKLLEDKLRYLEDGGLQEDMVTAVMKKMSLTTIEAERKLKPFFDLMDGCIEERWKHEEEFEI